MPLIIGLALALGSVLGYLMKSYDRQLAPARYEGVATKIRDILGFIQFRYVDSVSAEELLDKALRQIFVQLDPHSGYIPRHDLQAVEESLEGKFEGIGIEFQIIQDTITVIMPLEGGPSLEAGIMAGDQIVTIEDSAVAGVGVSNLDVMRILKGPKGTTVRVGIRRWDEPSLLSFSLKRGSVKILSILANYMVDEKTGYIKVAQFASSTYADFDKALDELIASGMQRLILDLRDNGGGYLDAAVRIADEFLDEDKLIVYTEGKAYPRKAYHAREKGSFESGALVVLINEGSASASEILAGAIQDWGRGAIVGRRSYGKGLVQDQIRLKDGSAIRLTIARYYTPLGRSLQRPYEEGTQAYHSDYVNRISEEISGNGGRISQDTIAWGILPGIYIPADTSVRRRQLQQILGQGIVQRFAYSYHSRHRDEFAGYKDIHDFDKRYQLPRSGWDQFSRDFLSRWELRAEEVLLEDDELRQLIKAFLARQLFYLQGFYYVLNQQDPEFLRAMEEVSRN